MAGLLLRDLHATATNGNGDRSYRLQRMSTLLHAIT
jgi:hypothetical protein